MFRKYQHVERFGTDEVEGIEAGMTYVFPKIDGTNSSVWLEDGVLHAASRKRELSLDNDNAGFFAYVSEDKNILAYLKAHPNHRLFGEWLVPHTLKTYRDDAWNKFYIFDVSDMNNEEGSSVHNGYIPYLEYQPLLEEYGLEYIPPLQIIKNGDTDDYNHCLDINDYLIKDGEGSGEGIVIKNYSFVNKYGRTTWAKIVRSEFKEHHRKAMGAPTRDNTSVETQIIEKYVTAALVEKEFAKIREEKNGWRAQYIPMLLSRVYYALINEEMWHILKDFKNPVINFKRLNLLCIGKVKEIKSEVF